MIMFERFCWCIGLKCVLYFFDVVIGIYDGFCIYVMYILFDVSSVNYEVCEIVLFWNGFCVYWYYEVFVVFVVFGGWVFDFEYVVGVVVVDGDVGVECFVGG